MRWTIAAACALLLAPPAAAQEAVRAGYRAAPDVSLRIWVPSGLVRLVAWDRDSIDVAGTTGKRGRYFGGGSVTHAKLGIESIRAGDTLLAGGDFTVRVPRKARVWVKMTLGHVDAEGGTGELDVYVVGGSVAIRNTAGVVSIEAIDAPVSVDGTSASLRIRSSKGDVTFRDVAGSATVSTVSGTVTLAGSRVPDARIETIGGAIVADTRGTGWQGLELQTHAGTITLQVSGASPPQLDVASRTGTVRNPFAPARGTNPKVTARSFKGDINVVAIPAIKGGK